MVADQPAYLPGHGRSALASREERIAAETPAARYARVMAERQAMGSSLRQHLAVMRKVAGPAASPQIPQSGGTALAGEQRRKMERQLGADLGSAHLHAGADSAKAADAMGARAFTVGSDVHFGSGEYAPGVKEGDRLLAHELTHVVQAQESGVQRKPGPSGRIEMIHDAPAPDPYITPIDHDARVSRKADDGAQTGDVAGKSEHRVSQPGDPAETEADAVADRAADALHGNGDKAAAEPAEAGHEPAPHIGAKLQSATVSLAEKKVGGQQQKEPGLDAQIATLRSGCDVHVKTVEEARKILAAMPELRPATEDRKMPNPAGRLSDGFDDPPGTYRGDLINKKKPEGPVHPGIANQEHANNPHYNIRLPNGKKAAIIIAG